MENKLRVVSIRVHIKTTLLSDSDDIGGEKDEKQRSDDASLWNTTKCRILIGLASREVNCLYSAPDKWMNPVQYPALNATRSLQAIKQNVVAYSVKSCWEVKNVRSVTSPWSAARSTSANFNTLISVVWYLLYADCGEGNKLCLLRYAMS